jgi:hypothetical protein
LFEERAITQSEQRDSWELWLQSKVKRFNRIDHREVRRGNAGANAILVTFADFKRGKLCEVTDSFGHISGEPLVIDEPAQDRLGADTQTNGFIEALMATAKRT